MAKKNHPFWSNIFSSKTIDSHVADLWKETLLFRGVSDNQARELVKQMQLRDYKKDEPIFSQGEIGIGAALIVKGRIEISTDGQVLAELAEGDFFGEVALVTDDTRTATATAATDSEVVFLLRPSLEEWVEKAPRDGAILLHNLAGILAHRLSASNRLIPPGEKE